MDYIKEDRVIEDVKKLLAIPKVNGVLFHALEEMKYKYQHEIKDYNELESTIDQEENQTDETKTAVKQVEFELWKKRTGWKVKPADKIPAYVIEHIINLDIHTGESHMEGIKIKKGKMINLVVSKHSNNHYTGSIKEKISPVIEKHPEKRQYHEVDKMPSIGREKKEELKTILKYLLNHEIFYDFVRRLFSTKWKSYLDQEIFKISDKEGIISG